MLFDFCFIILFALFGTFMLFAAIVQNSKAVFVMLALLIVSIFVWGSHIQHRDRKNAARIDLGPYDTDLP